MDTRTAGKKGAEKRWGNQPTKVQAIVAFLQENGGTASWSQIYANIGRFHVIDRDTDWKAGLRGVVYRECRAKKTFKMIKGGVVVLR